MAPRDGSSRIPDGIAARRRFARKGFHATTTDEIIAETGLSPATIYRYYPSKAALVETVCVRKISEIARYIDRMVKAESTPTPGEFFWRSCWR